MDMETLGYFLYMEECDIEYEQEKEEREMRAAVGKYKAEQNDDLVRERGTQGRY